jgi:hypothetical protein
MKILSKFKDYYDYVEYLYSQEGGDPANTYVRRDVEGRDEYSDECFSIGAKGGIPPKPSPKDDIYWKRNPDVFPWSYKWCSVCGKLYLLVTEKPGVCLPKYKLITEAHPSLDLVYSRSPGVWFKEPDIKDLIGVPNSACVEVSKKLQIPVFILGESYIPKHLREPPHITLNRTVPNLGELGFASLFTAEQMYQEIAMFLTSLRDNPDSLPPVDISDKDRLTQKGFDAKISFRGKPLK